ncbi:hypothetical protein CkaCkLH20_02008 [Colletotrichum karsti]|uniref:Uncharacterized protein n=1 Tax=Colletotrichum karsti TaxID=1095194 RepID=A0A9P6IC09_9PEZI|nr:uncharacterized protein CkaCkLH20_02008 [Colletotrichum karsti]KAF9880054.1 hypothetical protein CkaCkLH20_02008 [Colletotrichum karsti]
MPSTHLATRLRSGSSIPAVGTSSDASKYHGRSEQQPGAIPGGGTNVWREHQGAKEPRGRQKDAPATATAQRPDHYAPTDSDDRHYAAQSQTVPTEVMRQLGALSVRRAWRGRSGEAPPDTSRAQVVEAIMVHERGEVQTPDEECPRCQRGEGVSPECVKIPSIHNGACSNCLISRALARPGSAVRLTRSYSAERRSISATMSPTIPKEDLIAVWNLIAGVIATQPQECFFDDGTEVPGKRIEDAARLVARSADEWGHCIEEEGSEATSKTPKTPTERTRLVRQATRIRETALQIANCARDWGEKLERKKSTSQLRT